MKKRRVRFSLSSWWTALSSLIIAAFGIGLLLFAGLDSHIAGYSEAEVQSAYEARSLSAIAADPINAPHKLTAWAFAKVVDDPVLAGRLASAAFGSAAIIFLYIATRMWHGKRVAFLATLLFATSSWFLFTARAGTPDISATLAILTLALSGYWMRVHYKNLWSYVAVVAALALVVYVPGMIWLVVLALAVRGAKELRGTLSSLPRWNLVVLLGLLTLFVALPIAIAIIRDPQVLLSLLGLPEALPSITQMLRNIFDAGAALVAWHGNNSALAVGYLPIMDAISVVLAVLGVYYYWQKRRLDRTKLLVGALGVSLVLLALGVVSGFAMLLPVMFFLIAGGLAALLGRWLTVFPRNPLARSVGIIAIAVLVGFACFYNLRAYFVAAPHANNIQSIYNQGEDL